ncbi:Uncharacterized protein dnm_052210 [Desulfonema magnum]|uniref:Uncharacterized protein n=1 Tax=Desulfonema magnum TaxID=45655 RepID=A0A975GPM4_9BACT|nr:Uncharacterized protein dnm_052210 [Desulfonema magnum]
MLRKNWSISWFETGNWKLETGNPVRILHVLILPIVQDAKRPERHFHAKRRRH